MCATLDRIGCPLVVHQLEEEVDSLVGCPDFAPHKLQQETCMLAEHLKVEQEAARIASFVAFLVYGMIINQVVACLQFNRLSDRFLVLSSKSG